MYKFFYRHTSHTSNVFCFFRIKKIQENICKIYGMQKPFTSYITERTDKLLALNYDKLPLVCVCGLQIV
jgi:hypothetical protein